MDVKLFTRSSLDVFSSTTFIGNFITPFIPGCLRIPESYTSMMVKATNLINQTKPYADIGNLYDIRLTEPAYTYKTYFSQYTVKGSDIPRKYNKYIPDICSHSGGLLTVTMTVTVDLNPKYSIVDVRQLQAHTADENTPPVPVTSRLGPPVQRSFATSKMYKTPQKTETNEVTPEPKNRRPLKPKSLQF